MERDPLEYVLNRVENAAAHDQPAKHGYGTARKELLDGIAALRAQFAEKTAECEEAVTWIGAVRDETVQAGGWGGDRVQVLANIRKIIAERDAALARAERAEAASAEALDIGYAVYVAVWREGWEPGPTRNEAMDRLYSWLCDNDRDPNAAQGAAREEK